MSKLGSKQRPRFVVLSKDFPSIFIALTKAGFKIVGPKADNGAILYDYISSINDLPAGISDSQQPAGYALHEDNNKLLFNYNAGPNAWKKFLYPAKQKLWEAEKTKTGFKVVEQNDQTDKLALLGVLVFSLDWALV